MDFNRIAMLLHVVKESREYPRLAYIHNAAMTELEEINKAAASPEPAPTARPVARPEPGLKGPASPAQSGEGKRVFPAGTHDEEPRRA